MSTEKKKLLIVEDDESIRTQMKWAFVKDYDVLLAMDPEKAIDIMASSRPPLVMLDLGLPPNPEGTSAGLELLGKLLEFDGSTKVIVMTGNPDKSAALEAVSRGAHDFFTKPIDLDELRPILKRASYVHTLETEYKSLQKKLESTSFLAIIGTCPKMQDVFSLIRKVSTTEVPVLITGESGTGKELVSRAIHENGLRKEKPFIAINCGAIPENLMESELFGHERGAFTGAHAQKKGRIELAHEGTLFLDEIGELPLSLQVKLLRFLQDFKLERVGGNGQIEVDTRIIAATNKDLKKMVSEGRFREDLYYRLAVVSIQLPALRERGEDKTLIAKSFLHRYSLASQKSKSLSAEAIDALEEYAWPGNVRELENSIRRAVTLSEGGTITPSDMGLMEPSVNKNRDSAPRGTLKGAKDELEARLISESIARNDGNVSKAAEELGLTRPTLYHLIKKHKILKEVS